MTNVKSPCGCWIDVFQTVNKHSIVSEKRQFVCELHNRVKKYEDNKFQKP